MFIRRVFCGLLAVALTLAAFAMLFPDLVRSFLPEADISAYIDTEGLDISHFPFYGSSGKEGVFGLSDMVEAYADYVEKGVEPAPDFMVLLRLLTAQESFLSTLYAFALVSLLTIPVYMLTRLLVYNTLYGMAEDCSLLGRIFVRGIVAVSAALVTVSFTWLLQKRYLGIALDYLSGQLGKLTSVKFALSATNIAILIVIGFAVIALLRATLFRGSVFTSILGAVLRTLLFIVLIAIVQVFIGRMTTRTVLFMLAALLVIGIIKEIFLPEKASRSHRR